MDPREAWQEANARRSAAMVEAQAFWGRETVTPPAYGECVAPTREQQAVIDQVAPHGWTLTRTTKGGYLLMRCSCGEHQETVHKTPSNPRHFAQKVARMKSQCSRPVESGTEGR